jgi:DNA-binding NarL/FixJ family response regulator
MPKRILVADDHRLFREGLIGLLPPREFIVVAEAGDGHTAAKLAQKHAPDIAILDITMPGLNGVDTTREILRVSPATRIIVLTMHRESPYVVDAVRAGARGYVIKTQPAAELVEAIQTVARGDVYVARELSHALVDSFQDGPEVSADPLSARERQVLQLIAEGHTTKAIADELNISFKTAESHRGRIMAKLGIHETASLVRYAIRQRLVQA